MPLIDMPVEQVEQNSRFSTYVVIIITVGILDLSHYEVGK